MILSLIGMSNVGKTYFSKRLEQECGFIRFGCDERIAQELNARNNEDLFQDTADLAAWMGYPYQEGYQEREACYLEIEACVLQKIFQELKGVGGDRLVVIDTTGSVIYLDAKLLQILNQVSNILYLVTEPEQFTQMENVFFLNPKPLVWGDRFQQREDLSREENLRLCYRALLLHRKEQYEKLAHCMISDSRLKHPMFQLKELYEFVHKPV